MHALMNRYGLLKFCMQYIKMHLIDYIFLIISILIYNIIIKLF